jgi:ADP-heptose:LPS heptosyltransferase
MRILVIKPSSFGDIVQMLQVMEGAYQSAKSQGVELEIHWIVRDCFAGLLRCSPIIHQLFLFERHGGIKGFIRLIKAIRAHTYDFVVDGQGLLRSGLMTFFARSKHKLGRKDAREGSFLFYNATYAPQKEQPHAVEILQALLQPLKLQSVPQIPLTLSPNISEAFSDYKGAILLFPNSRGPKKEWPYFFELTQILLERTDKTCIWLGQNLPQKVPQHPRFINLMGKTALSDLPMLIQNAACVIANDSGPVHLAAALGKPLVGIYGPTDSRRYGPYPVADHIVFQAPQQDLKQISAEEVAQAVLKQLS